MKNQTVNFIAIIFTAALLITAYFLGLFVDLTGDAGKYGAIARHIIESGDWINLKIHGESYDQKPPLLFWLAALGFKSVVYTTGRLKYSRYSTVLQAFISPTNWEKLCITKKRGFLPQLCWRLRGCISCLPWMCIPTSSCRQM